MEIEHTALYIDALKVINSGKTTTNKTWEFKLHCGADDAIILSPLHLQSVNVSRDYVNNFSDVITISAVFGLGDYARVIYPHRVELEATLVLRQLMENSSEIDYEAGQSAQRFKAVLIDTQQAPVTAQGQEHNSREALNRTQIFTVHFQLVNKSVSQIRIQSTGGIFRRQTVKDTITSIISAGLDKIKDDEESSIKGVEVFDVDNVQKFEQVVITDGTRVVDVPGFIQERYGVYNSGLGSYVQSGLWYIYPLFDTTVYNKRSKLLNLIILPKRKFSNIERTFIDEEGLLTALVTGKTGFQDDSGTNTMNIGNGARFVDADNLMESAVSTGENKAIINRKDNVKEFLTNKQTLNHVAFKDRRLTANPFPIFSELTAINGGMIRCEWQNADAALLVPGMATMISYVDGDDVKQIYGVLHGVQYVNHNLGSVGSPRYKAGCLLDVFVNSQINAITE